MVGTKDTMSITARVLFGHTILSKGADPECSISVAADGSDSVQDVKGQIAVSEEIVVYARLLPVLLAVFPNKHKVAWLKLIHIWLYETFVGSSI